MWSFAMVNKLGHLISQPEGTYAT